MPRLKFRCRKCHQECHKNYMTSMECPKCGGLLVRVDSHLERRIERAKRNYLIEALDNFQQDSK